MTTATTPRWGDQIAVEVVNGIPYRMYTERPRRVEDLLAYAARWGTRPHVIQAERSVSFDELRHAVANKARVLAELGVKRGDRVFLIGWNGPEWVVNFWACLCAGAAPVLANTWWSANEMANGLALMQPALSLADAPAAAKLPAGARVGPWDIDVTPTADADRAPESSGSNDDEEATALVIFTSGTSGQPKAVVLTHRALLARLQMTLHITKKYPHQLDESAHDVTLITGPLFHVGGMQTLLRAVIVGDTIVLSSCR